MKILTSVILLSGLAFAADKPRPIPDNRQEEISRTMLILQNEQLNKVQLAAQAEAALRQADQRVTQAKKAFDDLMTKLRKEYDADGCDLNLDKTWNCPKKTDATSGAKPPSKPTAVETTEKDQKQ